MELPTKESFKDDISSADHHAVLDALSPTGNGAVKQQNVDGRKIHCSSKVSLV
jgi:hypothetical protein